MENTVTGDKLGDAALKLLADPEATKGRFFLWVHFLDCHADYLPHADGPVFGTTQRDLYDGEIAFTDKHVGRILDAIAAAPWGPRTAVIITSDHGEAFSEHKMVRHGVELWEELVHVPLLIHLPGVGHPVGTPTAMAPEQILGEPVDERIDVYALGVLLHRMLVGILPFRSEDPLELARQHLEDPAPRPSRATSSSTCPRARTTTPSAR